MRRRELLAGAVAAAASTALPAAAQSSLPIIGYFSSRSPEAETPFRAAFLEGLEKTGFVVGRNVAIEYRFGEGRLDRLSALAAELVGLPAAVLVAIGSDAAVAAKKTTATVPIVFGSFIDPVQLGLVASLNRPGGNATGVNSFNPGPKRLELMRELLPQPRLIATLFGQTTSPTPLQIREMEIAAQALGQPILVLQARDDDEVETVFARMAEGQVSGLVYGASTYFQVIVGKLVALAARYRIPAVYEWPQFVAAGGLMSYSAKLTDGGRLIGDYVGRILNGAAPADLPVVRASRFELVINLKTAQALRLTVPQALLARADEVID
jgi:ABC-type uncharacterized transport system substrate-binding protein